jgi:hypothetical protein
MLDIVQWTGPRKPIPVQLEDLGVKPDQVKRVLFRYVTMHLPCTPLLPSLHLHLLKCLFLAMLTGTTVGPFATHSPLRRDILALEPKSTVRQAIW